MEHFQQPPKRLLQLAVPRRVTSLVLFAWQTVRANLTPRSNVLRLGVGLALQDRVPTPTLIANIVQPNGAVYRGTGACGLRDEEIKKLQVGMALF